MARQALVHSLAVLLVGLLCLRCAAGESDPLDRFHDSEASKPPGNFSVHAEQYTGSLDSLASSTHCNITGQCIACTQEEQDSDPACRSTGFRQEITCIESFGAPSLSHHSGSANRTKGDASLSPQNVSSGNILESAPLKDEQAADRNATGSEEDTNSSDYNSAEDAPRKKRANDRQLLTDSVSDERRSRAGLRQKESNSGEDEEGSADSETRREPRSFRKYVTFESCSPWEEETLSVFGFEAIMLSLLVVCSPIVYQRKRKAVGAVAMTRVPSGSSRV